MVAELLIALAALGAPAAAGVAPFAGAQRAMSEKEARTPAQRKLDSQLLYEIYRRRGEAERKGVPSGATLVKIDGRGRALVDVRAEVGAALLKKIRASGATVVSTAAEYRTIIAWIPLMKLETLAGDASIRAIMPAPEAVIAR